MKLTLRVIAVLSFIVTIVWLIVAPSFDALTAFLAGVAALLTSFVVENPNKESETLDQRNRRVMLTHVENFWVKGILEKSLHGVALLELGIKEDPSAVKYPWTIKRESTNETLPTGKSMLEIFEEIGAGRSLLILGVPGSGKTTMLLELARQLIERASNDETEPIPVVFNLASWTEKLILTDWLVEQLNIVYYVPKKTALTWINENKMLLLLDGLDEVKKEQRSKCVQAINQYHSDHGLTSLVICSRVEEYQAINTKLQFEGAIKLQPLTSQQISDYLDKFGNKLASVRLLLRRDKALEELAETPLMLSIMIFAYEGKKPEEMPSSWDKEEQRKYLFDAYIRRMLERPTRASSHIFTKQQTLHYLCWLACKLTQRNMIIYELEEMQPSWLDTKKLKYIYIFCVMLIVGLVLGLIGLLIGGLVLGLTGLLIGVLIGGRNNGLIYYWVLPDIDKSTNVTQPKGIFSLFDGLIFGLFFGLFLAVLCGFFVTEIVNEFMNEMEFALHAGLKVGVSIGLIIWMQFGLGELIRHYTLRYILTKNGFLPGTLIHFLDYAVDLVFLRRVGRGYIFIHRLLMEHFAEMKVEKI